MYEGLTKDILNKSIFNELNIKVVSGKIKNSKGIYSGQIDCMLVEGDGENIPYTNEYIYDVNNVIAVIEVKKNLYSNELESAYNLLRSVINISEKKSLNLNMLRDSYRSFTNKELPNNEELEKLSDEEKMIYNLMIEENISPLRIVLGYDGFKSEYALRKSFINYLNANVTTDSKNIKQGFGVRSFPNLIICNDLSLVKLDGMPFALKIQYNDKYKENDFYQIYGSYPQKPLLIMLEFIWTRLRYKYNLSADIFGEDLKEEVFHPLLECKLIKKENQLAWHYKYHDLDQKFLESLENESDWEPCILNDAQGIIIFGLCRGENINIKDNFIDKLLKDEPSYINKDDFINSLKATYLVNVNSNGDLYLLTDACQVCLLPDGKIVAGENSTGRLTRWYNKNYNEKLVILI